MTPARRLAASLLLALAVAACAQTARLDKAALASDLDALATRAEATGAAWRDAYAHHRVTRERAAAWDTFLADFKGRFARLRTLAHLATPDELPALSDETRRLGADLAPWEVPR